MNTDKPLPADVVAIPVREHDDATAAELYDFVENAVEGLHRVGPDGTILWANRAELQMLGYGWEDYVGRHIADFDLMSEVFKKPVMLEGIVDRAQLVNVDAAFLLRFAVAFVAIFLEKRLRVLRKIIRQAWNHADGQEGDKTGKNQAW